ncbi:alcohol dehydrogenase catalytic domain-containing protein [Nocardiopsis sp. CT-R113]|uniref:Alcohol dehydrogenase catalytic domain-containing protein n=1 Tax=Nocardiopsis codii TaxID=3065942 RepID=A0ABU7K594_9ACTN|nr:alcohol dehydrogenase catalytic domain-containing protein [Nocardiopsis sp. CT-R113]MEE2037415.1 alcohol dehydrogenase catalytic domain-containing protein [Nocardiopsis sp. CT-R113]
MRATFMYGAGDVRVEEVPDPTIQAPTDAIVRVVRACVCGSDLHPYHGMQASSEGAPMGHEFLGVVEDPGSDVRTVRKGDFVIGTFAFQDNTCEFCREGFQTSCVNGGWYGAGGVGGAQAEALRVPQADGSLIRVPVSVDSDLLPSLLTLSDVYLTGYHAAHMARVRAGQTVTVIGDGAVGLSAVLAARQRGAERIILMGRHRSRTDLGREWGATDVVPERGEEGLARVMELTGGKGSHVVLEAVGHRPAYETAHGVLRPGGVISRVGVPQYEEAPIGFGSLFGRNATLNGGPAPVRAYIDQVLPDVLEGRIDPGRVFDMTVDLEHVADGYRAMDSRESLKALVAP